jgi:hypothetical protein
MASDDSSGPRPAAPILIRIKLRYDDVEVMVARFATNVGKSGLFLPTKSLQPIGAEIKFELRLADDTPVLVGLGRVKVAAAPDPDHPKATFGMAIELMRVTPQSRALILRMLERRRELGLPELGLPMPADIDAARRMEAAGAGVRDPASGPVPAPVAPSAPVAPVAPVAPSAPVARMAPSAPGTPAAPVAPIDTAPGEALLTAPRRQTGPMAVAKVAAVTPLAPEPPRRKRPAISELIESASGPIASVSVGTVRLDDDVDLAAAIARARALAGGALDTELEALSAVDAAPDAVSIEAASAELAKQLGGSAVRRDRGAQAGPPPVIAKDAPPVPEAAPVEAVPEPAAAAAAVAEPVAAPAAAAAAVAEPVAAPAAAAAELAGPVAAPAAAAAEVAEPVAEPPAEPVARSVASPNLALLVTEPGRPGSLPASSAEVADAVDAVADAVEPVHAPDPEHHEVEPEQIADEIHQLDDLDLEDVEHTVMGDLPGLLDLHGDGSESSAADHVRLAARLEAQLAEAEAEADADLGFGAPVYSDPAAGDPDPGELDAEPPEDAAAESSVDIGLEEVDELEILAEADADDADLLAAHGEQEASSSHEPHRRLPTGERRPSELDFAARLDLEDENDVYIAAPASEFATHHVVEGLHDELAAQPAHGGLHGVFDASAGRALAGFETGDELLAGLETGDESLTGFETGDQPLDDPEPAPQPAPPPPARPAPMRGIQPIFDDEPSSTFTLAANPAESAELDFLSLLRPDPGVATRPLKKKPPVSPLEPAILREEPRPSLYDSPVEDFELESALEALDIDLEDLSARNPAARRPNHGDVARSRPAQVIGQPSPAHPRSPVPMPMPAHPRAPTPSPAHPRAPTPSPAPSRTVRQTGPVAHAKPPPGRSPRARIPTDDGVVIDFDDDDE